MSIISKEELIKIASMSHMSLDDTEVEELTAQIGQVLEYAARVQEAVATISTQATQHSNVFREDEVVSTDVQPILAQAPAREEDYFVVPRILDHK